MGGFREELDGALDAAAEGEAVVVEADGGRATLDVVERGKLGVRLRGLKVERSEERGVNEAVERLERGLRALPERVVRSEVDPALGGAILRTAPEEMRDGEFTQVDVRGSREVEVTRHRRTPSGREAIDFTVTRGQLGRLLDEVVG